MVRLQLPRPAQPSVGEGGPKSKKKNKKRARHDDGEDGGGDVDEAGEEEDDGGSHDTEGDTEAGRVYQKWLEARYVDFLRVLLGWIAEVDDFHRQVMCLCCSYGCCSGSCVLPSAGMFETFFLCVFVIFAFLRFCIFTFLLFCLLAFVCFFSLFFL